MTFNIDKVVSDIIEILGIYFRVTKTMQTSYEVRYIAKKFCNQYMIILQYHILLNSENWHIKKNNQAIELFKIKKIIHNHHSYLNQP